MSEPGDFRASSAPHEALEQVMSAFVPDPASPHTLAIQQTVHLARAMQNQASGLQTPQERRQQAELDRMIHNPRDKVTLAQLTDQAFRAHMPHRAIDQLLHILDVQGIPRFFSPVDRALLKGFQSFGSYLPGVAAPLVKDKMQKETANVILPAETEMLAQHLEQRRQEGIRMNVNLLGEAILGEEEAQRRLNDYLHTIQIPEIEVVSVKISTIYSQIQPVARRHTMNVLCDRLELLFRAAAKETFCRQDGTKVPKFVYLDMEEYRDLAITADVFMSTLDRPGMEGISAGLVLQAYLPDSYPIHQRVNQWAQQRVASGGATVTLRLVKGANMEMERLHASVHGWPQVTYRTKPETDANFKRLLHLAMENLDAVRLGVASHNLFDLAYGLVLAWKHQALDRVQFEMLEGMANHQRRALFLMTRNLLLYAPACKKADFVYAIGYLIRRLDENTGPDNFLSHAFKLQVGGEDWNRLEQGFLDSFRFLEGLSAEPRRQQNRNLPIQAQARPHRGWQNFANEPDTDFSLTQNVQWAEAITAAWKDRCDQNATPIPLVIDGEEFYDGRPTRDCLDPSRPGVVVGRYQQATAQDVQRAVACAASDADGWRSTSAEDRSAVLYRVAHQLRVARGELMGAALADGGKTLLESDPEVSEAIDFAEFYGETAKYYDQLPGLSARGRGVVAVVSPWNFPISIPAGGVAAALAAGNTVILKPASDTVLAAYILCQCFWQAGVSRKTLQLLPCSGATDAQQLVRDEGVDTVLLTGGTETARAMLDNKPTLRLLAETGGKNATIVTALSDRDQAIQHVLHSAFSHSGQKCSATSLLILEEEVYEDPGFRRTLCDAVESLEVGSVWEPKNRVGPLIRPPTGALERGLKELETHESWAVMPHRDEENPQLYSPAVKWDVQPTSFTHKTELFGPVLGVMKATDLHAAIELVNQTRFGLTSGLESLDDREQQLWTSRIRAGNLYINRSTTGAIVLRQPFGGMGKSAFGSGIKAGGPNYVAQLMHLSDDGRPPGQAQIGDAWLEQLVDAIEQPAEVELASRGEVERLLVALHSYGRYEQEEFGRDHDHFRLIGQDNIRRYLPVREMRLRLHPADSWFEIAARICAAKMVGCRITVSLPTKYEGQAAAQFDRLTEPWAGAIEFVEESDERLVQVIRQRQTDRVRYAAPDRVPVAARQAAAETNLFIADAPVRSHGRIELLWYVQEQSLSVEYHRYGNLGARVGEERASTL